MIQAMEYVYIALNLFSLILRTTEMLLVHCRQCWGLFVLSVYYCKFCNLQEVKSTGWANKYIASAAEK